MSLYQKIKSAITVRQVGEMYGMEPDRHGMVCCPFHSDSDPSMKLNDTYYYCFGCGANGDAIDLTAKLFDLNPRQAAEKLINDFAFAKQCSPQWGLQVTERSCVSKMEGPRPDKFAFGVRIGRVVDECRPVKGCIRKWLYIFANGQLKLSTAEEATVKNLEVSL